MKKKYLFSICITMTTMILTSCIVTNEKENPSNNTYNREDYKNVEMAILNYVDALYLVDSTKIIRSVDTTLRKVGYWYNPNKKQYVDNLEMTYKKLVRLSSRWNSEYDQADENSPKHIEIFDVNSKTASAKLTAVWGIDLFHLAKVDNEWKIINVIWQSQPKLE